MPVNSNSIQGFGSDGTRMKRWHCPKGHLLEPWMSAGLGTCDGCKQSVRNGERVMDCRQCNWYLCDRCHPQECSNSIWDTFTAAFDTAVEDISNVANDFDKKFESFVNVITCHAPDKEEMEFNEIDIRPSNQEKHDKTCIKTVDKVCPDANNNENHDDCKDVKIAEKKNTPAVVVEKNLIEFEQDDLLDLSQQPIPATADVSAAPLLFEEPILANTGASSPPSLRLEQSIPATTDMSSVPLLFEEPIPATTNGSSPPLLCEQPMLVEAPAIPSANTGNGSIVGAGTDMDLISFDPLPSSSSQPAALQGQGLI